MFKKQTVIFLGLTPFKLTPFKGFWNMRAIILRTLQGMGVGVLLALVGFFSGQSGYLVADLGQEHDVSVFGWAWIVLNYPARLLFQLWVFKLRLPPQNDVLVVAVLPSIAVLLQWLAIGFIAGIWTYWTKKRLLQPA